MARNNRVTYTCDACGGEVERPRDLRRYEVDDLGPGGRQWKGSARTELCGDCREKFMVVLAGFFLVDSLEAVAGHPDD